MPLPVSNKASQQESVLSLQQPAAAALAPTDGGTPSISIRVSLIQITGNTQIDTHDLHALVADAEGQALTLAALTAVIERITRHYQLQGFPLAKATLPAQTILDGVVKVQVIEARYGAIAMITDLAISGALLPSAMSALASGQVITQAPLDQALLWLSDIPGLAVSASLKPGAQPGESDLEVHTHLSSEKPTWTGSSVLDNYGNQYTGATRAFQNLRITDPFNRHDGATMDINALSSGPGLSYGRIAYETVFSHVAIRAGAGVSSLQYKLDGVFADSAAQGSAKVTQVWLRRSFRRGYTENMEGQIQYEKTAMRDRVGLELMNVRDAEKIMTSMKGNAHDKLWPGTFSDWNVSLTSGKLSNEQLLVGLATSPLLQKHFNKFNADVSFLQQLTAKDAFYATLKLQLTGRSLDASEKMIIGGANSVRALAMGGLSGDQGAALTMEYRHILDLAYRGQWQISIFLDNAMLAQQIAGSATERPYQKVTGAGAGLLWSGPERLTVKAQWSQVIGSPVGLPSTETRLIRSWLEVAYAF